MSFNIGLSGIRAASSDLSVTGNNIANASTVGFKQSRAEFSDVYAASVLGTGKNQIGSGVLLSSVSQLHNQGTIDFTQSPLDMAINGGGFFITSNNGAISYTRAGYFGTDKNGFIVDRNGYRLQGYAVNSQGQLQSGVVGDLNLETTNQAPKPTSLISQTFNLNSTNTVPALSPFNPKDPTTYNSSTSVNIYDSQGNAHVMTQYFSKTSSNTWVMSVLVDGRNPANPTDDTAAINAANTAAAATGATATSVATAVAGASGVTPAAVSVANAAAALPGATADSVAAAVRNMATSPYEVTLNFNSSGQLISQVPGNNLTGNGFSLDPNDNTLVMTDWVPAISDGKTPPTWTANGATANASGVVLDVRKSTQYATSFAVNSISQDGHTTGELSGLEIDDTGLIFARYTNGQSKIQGQVILANFANVQGLVPVGKTSWIESTNSGEPVIGTPRSGTLGALQSGALELSNVELSNELVDLIVAQRNYQANAKTIQAEDAVTQTIINLR